jgi:hypothetical protein
VDSVLHDTKTQKCNLPAGAAHMKFFQENLATTSDVTIYTYGTRFGHMLTVPPGKLKPVPE